MSLQKAMQYAAKHKITSSLVPRVGESLICRARQNTLVDYMGREFDYLFTVDDDIEIPIDCIVKLVESGKDIIGGFYRLKKDHEAHTAIRPLYGNKTPLSDVFKNGSIHQVQYISTGCMLVASRVIHEMVKKYPELEYDQNITFKKAYAFYQPFIHTHPSGFREYLSEDWAFCQRATDAGFKVWADGSVRCGHWGLIKYDFEE